VLASSRAERSGIVGQILPLSSGGGEPTAGGRSAGSRSRAEDPGVGRIYGRGEDGCQKAVWRSRCRRRSLGSTSFLSREVGVQVGHF